MTRRRSRLIIGASVACALVVVAAAWWAEPSAQDKIDGALAYGRLAPLPANARNVQVATIGNMFSRQFWIRFEADASDIETFLEASEGLRNVKPLVFTTVDERRAALGLTAPDGTAELHPSEPFSWYRPSDVIQGRYYQIPWDANALYGSIVVDDATNTVYVSTGHS